MVSRTRSQGRAPLTSLLWCLDLWAGRLVGHCPANQSREVRAHRDIAGKSGEAYHGCLETGPRSKWFSISSWSARYGPLRSSTPCVARCRPISSQEPASVLPRSSTPRSGDDLGAGPRPEKHGGRVSTAASSRARCLETPRGSAFESPGHRTWSGGRRWGTRAPTRGRVLFAFSLGSPSEAELRVEARSR